MWANFKPDIGRLHEWVLDKESVKDVVDRVEHGCGAAKIRRERLDDTTALGDLVDYPIEGLNVCSTKRIDRLIWIADNKKLPGIQPLVLPCGLMTAEVLRHRKNDFILNRIGILELIDQHRPVLSLDPFPDSGMRVEETPRPRQQTVK